MWKAIFSAVLLSRALHAVKVTTKSPVVSGEGSPEVILPCEYVLDNPADQPVIIRWQKERETVLVRDSSGKIFAGPGFTNRCSFNHGCSLLLRHPTQNDSGKYTVKVTALRGEVNSCIAHTEVIVTKGVTRKITVLTTSKPFINVTQQHEGPKADIDAQYITTLLVIYSLWAVVCFLALIHQIVLIWKHVHGDEKDLKGSRLRLPSRIITILLLICGEIVLITGVTLRNWTCAKGVVLMCFELALGAEVWEGDRAVLPCGTNNTDTDVQWCKETKDGCNNVAVKLLSGKKNAVSDDVRILENSSLEISSVKLERDDGSYQCQVKRSSVVELVVLQPVKAVKLTYPDTIQLNTTVNFTCEVIGGKPAPNISWYLDDVLNETRRATKEQRKHSIYKVKYEVKVTKEMNGQTIKCRASVRNRSLWNETTIDVKFKPSVTIRVHPNNYGVEDDITLICTGKGNPNPVVKLLSEGKVLSSSPQNNSTGQVGETFVGTATYKIDKTAMTRDEKYTCFATNDEGNKTSDFVFSYSGTRTTTQSRTVITVVPWCLFAMGLIVSVTVFFYRRNVKKTPSDPVPASDEEATHDVPACQPANPVNSSHLKNLQGHYATVHFDARPPQQVTPQVPGTSTQQDDRTIYASVDFKATAKLAKRINKRKH